MDSLALIWALAKIWIQLESVYRSATVVANICVYAATNHDKPIAIIVPAEPALKKLAHDNGIEGHGIEDLVHDPGKHSWVVEIDIDLGYDYGSAKDQSQSDIGETPKWGGQGLCWWKLRLFSDVQV